MRDPYEGDADRAASAAIGAASSGSVPVAMHLGTQRVQRKCAECESGGEMCEECAREAPTPASDSAPLSTTAALLVDDEVSNLASNQMRKSEFVSQLRQAVCTAADEELARAGRSTSGCPHLAYWFTLLDRRDAQFLERGIRKFAPEARRAKAADDYIDPVVGRVRRSVAAWVETGRVIGVPTDLTDLGTSEEAASPTPAPTIGRKELAGAGSSGAADPAAIRSELGAGRVLDAGVRSRMESAFNANFSRVRVHADVKGSRMSSALRAKAFTVGEHVAFDAGEYRPGTLLGDALIAHELAHVVQQGAATQTPLPGTHATASLEHDADRSAIGAVASLWRGSIAGLGRFAREAVPRLRSGMQLQRCSSEQKTCPKGKEWAVMDNPAGVGPVCICRWHCVPASAPRYTDVFGTPVTSMSCNPPCPPPPRPDVVGDDFVQEEKGTEDPTATGVGAHMTGLTSAPACGCIRPDNLVGAGPKSAPLKQSGFEVTDLSPRAAKELFEGRKIAPPPFETSRIVVEGPAVAGQPVRAKVAPVKAPSTGAKGAIEGVPVAAPVVTKPAQAAPPAGKAVLAPPAAAKPGSLLETDPSARLVWGTGKSKIFHEQGSTHFERMKSEGFPNEKGRLMTAAEAEAAGFRAAETSAALEAARRGAAEHAMIAQAMRPDEGKLHGEGWRLVKVERTVGGTKRVDEMWVNDTKKRVFVADTFTGEVEPPEHYQKGWDYAKEPEIKALLDQGYTYDYSVAIKHPSKLH